MIIYDFKSRVKGDRLTEVEVDEEKQAIVKSAPVLPTDRQRRARRYACDFSQLVRGVCVGRTCDRRFTQAFSN